MGISYGISAEFHLFCLILGIIIDQVHRQVKSTSSPTSFWKQISAPAVVAESMLASVQNGHPSCETDEVHYVFHDTVHLQVQYVSTKECGKDMFVYFIVNLFRKILSILSRSPDFHVKKQ